MNAQRPWRRSWVAILLLTPLLLSGCSVLQGGRLLSPQMAGLEPVAPRLYIEAGDDEREQARRGAELKAALARAEEAIRHTYGEVRSRPVVHACFTEACYAAFGGRGSVAKVYGDRILLSPRGLNWHFLAHEWSHAEMRSRLSWRGWWHMPQWFDEGVAVTISEAPEHSEAHWRWLVAHDVARPSVQGLRRLRTLDQWLAAVHRHGEDQNAQRRARGEPEIHPVYTAAGQELRPWLQHVGTAGLLRLIDQVNAGAPFDEAYDAATASTAKGPAVKAAEPNR